MRNGTHHIFEDLFISNKLGNWFQVLGAFLFLIYCPSTLASTWNAPSSWDKESMSNSHSTNPLRKSDLHSGETSPFSPGSQNIAIDMGQVFLMGDLTRYTNTIGTQLHYTYGVSDLFSFDSSIGYSQHSSGKYSMTTLLSGMRMNLAWYDKLIPYGVFGLGFYRPYYEDNTVPPSQNNNGSSSPASISSLLFGIHLGAGIDLELNKSVFFGASLTLHNMFGSTQTWGNGTPLNIGGTFTSFLVHIGTTF